MKGNAHLLSSVLVPPALKDNSNKRCHPEKNETIGKPNFARKLYPRPDRAAII
jgi:hypothetical protein